MASNPYEAPDSLITEPVSTAEQILASRWQRLGAALIDGVVAMVLNGPMIYWYYRSSVGEPWLFEYSPLLESELFFSVFTMVFIVITFLLCNAVLLSRYGQTIGKRLLGIKIVDYGTGEILSLKKVIGFRYLPQWLASNLPVGASLLPLLDSLFIFGESKRCIHDLIANTKVIRVTH